MRSLNRFTARFAQGAENVEFFLDFPREGGNLKQMLFAVSTMQKNV
jgi:hypothetical protein